MKKALLLPLALLMAAPATAGVALAHPGPGPHYHRGHVHAPHVRVYRRRPAVVIVPRRPPPAVIVVEEPPPEPTVIRRAPPERAVARRHKRPKERSLLGLGLRVSGSTLSGEKLGLDSAENSVMGGVGLQLRSRFNRSLGMEISAEILSGSGDNFDQRTIPVMASLTYHLFPTSRVQPYVIAGAGVHFTRLEYLDGRYVIDTTELAGQLGAGLEIFITKNLAIHADLRAQTIFKNLDTQEKIRQDCLHQVGSQVGFCDNIHDADPDDKFNLGVQFQAGASWYF